MSRTGKAEQAIASVEQAVNRQPDSEAMVVACASFYALSGDVDKAKRRLGTFIARKPEAASTLDFLGEFHQKTGDLPGARIFRSKAARLYLDQASNYRAAVMNAWLEANPVALRPEPPSREATPAPEKST